MQKTPTLKAKNQIRQWILNELVPNYSTLSKDVREHVKNIIDALVETRDRKIIQSYCRQGMLTDVPLLRGHLWKILLQTITLDPETWIKSRSDNYKVYNTLVKRFFPTYLDEEDLIDINDIDFKRELWNEVTLDTKRTHTALNYFQSPIPYFKLYANSVTTYGDVLARILYIWARTNSTVKYVQGMNQILAPIFYLQFQKITPESQSQVFFMYSSIITFVIDMHIKEMDNYEHGIMGRIKSLNKYLKVTDLQLWQRLQNEGIEAQFYSFRWLSLLLSQQFGLFETQKLWDHLFSFEGYKRFFFHYSLCLAILNLRKEFIMNNEFIHSLPCLQKLRDLKVNEVIQKGCQIYQKYSKMNIQALYKQLEAVNTFPEGVKVYRAKTMISNHNATSNKK